MITLFQGGTYGILGQAGPGGVLLWRAPSAGRSSARRASPPCPPARTRWGGLYPWCSPPLPVSQGITGAENPGGARSPPSLSLAPSRLPVAKQVENRMGKRGLLVGVGVNHWSSLAAVPPGSCQTLHPARSCLPCRGTSGREFLSGSGLQKWVMGGSQSCIHS